jgi:hypothetical protein
MTAFVYGKMLLEAFMVYRPRKSSFLGNFEPEKVDFVSNLTLGKAFGPGNFWTQLYWEIKASFCKNFEPENIFQKVL